MTPVCFAPAFVISQCGITPTIVHVASACCQCMSPVHVTEDPALSVVPRWPSQFLIDSTLFFLTVAKYIMNAFAEIN